MIGNCRIKPGAPCAGQSLVGADLSGADLSGADLSGANLHGVNLRGAQLQNVSFAGADLSGTDLSYADVTGANFTGSDLSGATLLGATTGAVDLTGDKQCGLTFPSGSVSSVGCPPEQANVFQALLDQPRPAPTATAFRVARDACTSSPSGTQLPIDYGYVSPEVGAIVTFSVDGVAVETNSINSPPAGTVSIPFICDGKPHTISMTLVNSYATPPVTETLTTSALLRD